MTSTTIPGPRGKKFSGGEAEKINKFGNCMIGKKGGCEKKVFFTWPLSRTYFHFFQVCFLLFLLCFGIEWG